MQHVEFTPRLPPGPCPLQVPQTGQDALYITGKVMAGPQLLVELRFHRGTPGVAASVKCERQDLAPLTFDMLNRVLA